MASANFCGSFSLSRNACAVSPSHTICFTLNRNLRLHIGDTAFEPQDLREAMDRMPMGSPILSLLSLATAVTFPSWLEMSLAVTQGERCTTRQWRCCEAPAPAVLEQDLLVPERGMTGPTEMPLMRRASVGMVRFGSRHARLHVLGFDEDDCDLIIYQHLFFAVGVGNPQTGPDAWTIAVTRAGDVEMFGSHRSLVATTARERMRDGALATLAAVHL